MKILRKSRVIFRLFTQSGNKIDLIFHIK
jgi:hypothetical protein